MSHRQQLLAIPSLTGCDSAANNINVQRRYAGYHPSVWGDHFLTNDFSSPTNHVHEKEVSKLKVEVKEILMTDDSPDKPLEKLDLIDKIQRLGIAYHFEKEIEQLLKKIYNDCFGSDDSCLVFHDNLHTTALMFRLLRQNGYSISCDVFNKFKDGKGNFDESLSVDVKGLLSLYEASHLRIHGEDTLDEALAFTVSNLKSFLDNDQGNNKLYDSSLVAQVKLALNQCLHKGLTRLSVWYYINMIYDDDQTTKDSSYSRVLLTLAKLDFNLLQKQHQRELQHVTKWWKDLEVEKNFPFTRDRITECYFWILGVYFEPEYSLGRNILTKVISLTSIMDDMYDAYGTIEELELLTNAINKWDIEVIYELPAYMQVYYKAFLNVYKEIEEMLVEQGRFYRFLYAKEAMKKQANVYFKEAQWFNQNYTPTLEEYMSLALETSGYGTLAITSLLGMGDNVASKEAFDWLVADPKILRASKIVCRLTDDIVSHEFEQERGHLASAVECYMNQYNITKEETEKLLWKQIDDAWKDINEECLKPTHVPMPILTRILNLTRVIEVLYKDKDCYTHSTVELKGYVDSVLAKPIPL